MSASTLNATHDPALTSWVPSANASDTDFPIQNLPLGRFRLPGELAWRIGTAVGNQVLDLRAAGFIDHADMSTLLQQPSAERQALRAALSAALTLGSRERARLEPCLYAQSAVELGLPCDTRDYTDFYIGIHHATAIGRLFRPENPLLPNYRWVPIGYHGRASTLIASGEPVIRPQGQVMSPGATTPELRATQRLDIELELGVVIGRGNPRGKPVPLSQAEDHIAGLTLLNDWSARDIQPWEYQPLGPFLAKNFATTLSPWIVTLEALAPFRRAMVRPPEDPPSLPYLESETNRQHGAFEIALEVWIDTPAMRTANKPMQQSLTRSNFAEAAYWTIAQMVAHHTVNGCALATGDVLGTGTLSGPRPDQAGSLIELTGGGKQPFTLFGGETRAFLQDGDRITLRAQASAPGARRIGFGACVGTVVPRE